MRSSKSRSRSKQNRPRSIGNIVNRVFDSSGPEGKVRGTPQQIIEKYQALARDAQLSNDRVAAENFLQHAEHYTRMLGEAMRELAAEQEARRHQHGGQGGNGNGNGQPQGGHDRPPYQPRRDEREDEQPDVGGFALAVADEGESGLVETPEARAERRPAQDARREDGRRDDSRRDEPREGREPREQREPRESRDQREPRRDDQPRSDRKPQDRKPSERKSDSSRKPHVPAAAEPAAPAAEAAAPKAEAVAPQPEPVAPKPAEPAAPPAAEPVAAPEVSVTPDTAPEAASKPRRTRSPRKPRSPDGTPAEGPSSDAAE